jgi:hypothetical protein
MLRIRAGSTPQTCRRGHHVLLTANLRHQTPTRQDMAIMRAAVQIDGMLPPSATYSLAVR